MRQPYLSPENTCPDSAVGKGVESSIPCKTCCTQKAIWDYKHLTSALTMSGLTPSQSQPTQ